MDRALASALSVPAGVMAQDLRRQDRTISLALHEGGSMAQTTKSIEVNVPVRTAYNQWTQFEEFPMFMEGVESVQQVDDTHLVWSAEIGGKKEEWRAEITEQHPDHRVAWKSTEGRENAGVVTFHQIDHETTRVAVQ